MNRTNVGFMLLVAFLFSLLSPKLCSAADATGPFPSCLTGRYVTTGSGLDITLLNPFAVVGVLNFTCTSSGTGTFTGSTIVTYPVASAAGPRTVTGSLLGGNQFNNVVFPTICNVTGTYTIDPTTGLIASVGTIGNPATNVPGLNACLDLFRDTSLQEFGYLSDPTAQSIYELETGQQQSQVLNLVYTKAGTANIIDLATAIVNVTQTANATAISSAIGSGNGSGQALVKPK